MMEQDNSRQIARDLSGMFAPRAIAVIGASAREGTVGFSVFQNLLFNRYSGTIYPVNPKRKSLLGVRCYADVKSIGDPEIDLAMIIIPAKAVPDALRDCGAAGVGNAVIISAGFKEVGGDGARMEGEVKALASELGISLLGPNCLGIINTDPDVSMNASFSRTMPQRGNIGFISQSGALCTAILDYARGNNIGFSKFISFGNKVDVNENDLLSFLADDPHTDVILMYIEDLTDGRRFIDIARETTGERQPSKPILAIKTGRTAEGAGAAASHTGSLAGTDEVYDAILSQSGVLRVETVEDLFDYAMSFASQPLPQSNRLAIVTNAGGPGIMTTDACVRYGLKLSKLAPDTVARLREKLPTTANFNNPIDVIGDAQHDRYKAALEEVLADPNVDATIVILTPQNMTDIEAIADVVWETSRKFYKPMIASFMGLYDVSKGVSILREHGIPHYAFPESAARSLAAMYRYTQWTHRPRTEERRFDVDKERVRSIIDGAIGQGRRNLPEIEAIDVLKAYGFPTLRSVLARSAADAVALARDIGYPVVLKIASPDILHKTDIGGIKVGVRGDEEVRQGFDEIVANAGTHRPEADIWGVTVQEMAPTARAAKEVILGATRDPKFGPLLMFGLGGIYTEALKDVAFRLAPIRSLGADRMIESIRAHSILDGVRGEPPSDKAALAECLERLSQLVTDFPQIGELDINPLFVYPVAGAASAGRDGVGGALVVDGRIILTK